MMMTQERMILKGQVQLEEMAAFVRKAAKDGCPIDVVERSLWQSLLALGHTLLASYVGDRNGDAASYDKESSIWERSVADGYGRPIGYYAVYATGRTTEKAEISGDTMKTSCVPVSTPSYAGLLREGLKDITSPLLSRISQEHEELTLTEVQVCQMIRQGLTAKEIAQVKSISPITVFRHRQSIRKKLGVTNKRVNLAIWAGLRVRMSRGVARADSGHGKRVWEAGGGKRLAGSGRREAGSGKWKRARR